MFIIILFLIKALNAFIIIFNNVNIYFKYNKISYWAKEYINKKVNIINILLIYFLKVINTILTKLILYNNI